MDNDLYFMGKALEQAKRSLLYDEVPVGAVVVNDKGIIIGRGYNKVEKNGTQNDHAEIIAIRKAAKKVGDWRLQGCSIYVTLEPCLMCFGLIQLSRIEKIIFGAPSTLFGASLMMANNLPTYAKHLQVEGGVKRQECLEVIKMFFKEKRKKGKR